MLSRNFTRGLRFHLQIMKTFPPQKIDKTSTINNINNVAKTNCGMLVAWHSEPDFPYECTKPIQYKSGNQSILKENAINNAMEAFKKNNPEIVRQELSNITFTTKHVWFPRSRDRKAKKTPMDRKYL